MYEFLREKTTSFSALLGIDTTSVFLHGIRLAPRTRIVKGGNGLWHAVKSLRGVSVIMQMSHGASGRKWEPASKRTMKGVVRETAKELAPYIPGGVAVAYLEYRLKTASITRVDTTQDLQEVRMKIAEIIAPKDKYGAMRNKRFRASNTKYWGKRGGYMKDPDDNYITDDEGKKVYQRASAKQVRVYDKRAQMLDSRGIDLGKDVTRIEITLNGNKAVRQNLGFGTLQEYFDCPDAGLHIRTLFDELTVKVDGEYISPLTPAQRKKAEGNPRLAKKLKRNEKRRKKWEREEAEGKMQTVGNAEFFKGQDAHCLYEGGPGAWEFRRGDWVFVPEDPCPCPGAGGTPGRVDCG